jgi:hypothetical protein
MEGEATPICDGQLGYCQHTYFLMIKDRSGRCTLFWERQFLCRVVLPLYEYLLMRKRSLSKRDGPHS